MARSTDRRSVLILVLLLVPSGGDLVHGSPDRISDTAVPAAARTDRPHYYTVGPLEPDRVSSAWLIQRYVTPGSEVSLLPKGADPPQDGILFDAPGVPWSRRHDRSAYEAILESETIDSPELKRIGSLVRAGELTYWMLDPDSEAGLFDLSMKALADSGDVSGMFALLDSLVTRGGVMTNDLVVKHKAP